MPKRRYKKRYSRKAYARRKQKAEEQKIGFILFIGVLIFLGAILSTIKVQVESFVPVIVAAISLAIPLGIFFVIHAIYKERKQKNKEYEAMHSIPQLLLMDPFEFEHFVGWVFKNKGYKAVVSRARGDEGIDIMLKKDLPAGKAGGERYAVQVKRYKKSNTVGQPALREFFGSFAAMKVRGGFFVTTSDFTKQAKEWAKGKPIRLINGVDLVALMKGFETAEYYTELANEE